jgi:hypothetical protein
MTADVSMDEPSARVRVLPRGAQTWHHPAMRRRLACAFVATAAYNGAACSSPTSNPPPTPAPSPTVTLTAPQPGTSDPVDPLPVPAPHPKEGQANPRDAEGRTVMLAYNGDDQCFVYLPWPPLEPGEKRYPGMAPPTEVVSCPPEMKSPAYKSCRGGIISYKDGGCECFEHGNPPRVEPNACP